MSAAARQFDHIAVEMRDLPFGQRSLKTRGDDLRRSSRHNPLGIVPPTDDVIALRLENGGFSDPQTLTHTRPIESQSGASITGLQTFPNDERILTSVSFS